MLLLFVCCYTRRWWQWLSWKWRPSAVNKSSELQVYEDSPVFSRKSSHTSEDLLLETSVVRTTEGEGVAGNRGLAAVRGSGVIEIEEVKVEEVHTSMGESAREVRVQRKWPMSWYWQFGVLTVRTFRQSRHVIFPWSGSRCR